MGYADVLVSRPEPVGLDDHREPDVRVIYESYDSVSGACKWMVICPITLRSIIFAIHEGMLYVSVGTSYDNVYTAADVGAFMCDKFDSKIYSLLFVWLHEDRCVQIIRRHLSTRLLSGEHI
jgi:hypothetical protein